MLKNDKLQRIGFFSVITTVLALLAACNSTDSADTDPPIRQFERAPLSSLALEQPADCSTFKFYIYNSLVKRYTNIPEHPYYILTSNSAGAASPASGPDGVSQTNNQETGVNESDMVKVNSTDGTLFIGHGSNLIIAKAFPPQTMDKIREIDFGGMVINLFYDENNQRLIVMTRYRYQHDILASSTPPPPDPLTADLVTPSSVDAETIVTILDVSSPADPLLIDQLSIPGHYLDSRRIDNRLHLVTRFSQNTVNFYLDPEFRQLKTNFDNAVFNIASADPGGYDPAKIEKDPFVILAKTKLTKKISRVMATTDAMDFLPRAKRGGASNQTDIPQYILCADVYISKIEANLGMQVVTSMNTDGSNVAASAAVNNSWLTYVSPTHLYMAERSNNWFWDKANIDQTAIHKFAISENKPQYISTGSVDGHANRAFNFSEHNNVLRVATTQTEYKYDATAESWQRTFKNHLTILQDDDNGKMNTISEIRDLAIGETIRGVRFLANRGFIVTFRNIDPLFTFDLTDPMNPLLKGELKIPGFSSYLHPYGNNHLITIGREGSEDGTGLGNDLQLQLIDVSDLSKPEVIHKYTPDVPTGSSWSSAQYDHHAFTFYEPENLLAIPIQISSYDNSITPFSGVVTFNVSQTNGFTELGRVDHADLAKQFYCVDNTVVDGYLDYCDSGFYAYWASPRRTVVMTDGPNVYQYTISDVGLKANEISDFNVTLGSLIFPPQVYPWYGGAW